MASNGDVEEREETEIRQQLCQTEGCERPASLQCPTCIKLEIEGSFFCSQVTKEIICCVYKCM